MALLGVKHVFLTGSGDCPCAAGRDMSLAETPEWDGVGRSGAEMLKINGGQAEFSVLPCNQIWASGTFIRISCRRSPSSNIFELRREPGEAEA